MGVDYNVYVGPYILCVNSTDNISVVSKGCPNCKKIIFTSFCCNCGTKIGEYTETKVCQVVDENILFDSFVKSGLNYYRSLAKIQSSYYDFDEGDIFVSNTKGLIGLKFDPTNSEGILLSNANPQQDILEMANLLKCELEVLQRLYKQENVTIRWGVISYAN